MKFSQAVYTAIGKRRNNEDAAAIYRGAKGLLAVVADGLGGQAFGERASRVAVESFQSLPERTSASGEELEAAVDRADKAVGELQRRYPGAMTTVAALWLEEGRAFAVHIGDTRIYQFREGAIVFQSEDHSMAQLAVKKGEIRPEDIRSYPERNVLFRALGGRRELEPQARELSVLPGDRFLLCSDGFWETITEERMLAEAARCPTAEEWLAAMRKRVEPAAIDNNTAAALVAETE